MAFLLKVNDHPWFELPKEIELRGVPDYQAWLDGIAYRTCGSGSGLATPQLTKLADDLNCAQCLHRMTQHIRPEKFLELREAAPDYFWYYHDTYGRVLFKINVTDTSFVAPVAPEVREAPTEDTFFVEQNFMGTRWGVSATAKARSWLLKVDGHEPLPLITQNGGVPAWEDWRNQLSILQQGGFAVDLLTITLEQMLERHNVLYGVNSDKKFLQTDNELPATWSYLTKPYDLHNATPKRVTLDETQLVRYVSTLPEQAGLPVASTEKNPFCTYRLYAGDFDPISLVGSCDECPDAEDWFKQLDQLSQQIGKTDNASAFWQRVSLTKLGQVRKYLLQYVVLHRLAIGNADNGCDPFTILSDENEISRAYRDHSDKTTYKVRLLRLPQAEFEPGPVLPSVTSTPDETFTERIMASLAVPAELFRGEAAGTLNVQAVASSQKPLNAEFNQAVSTDVPVWVKPEAPLSHALSGSGSGAGVGFCCAATAYPPLLPVVDVAPLSYDAVVERMVQDKELRFRLFRSFCAVCGEPLAEELQTADRNLCLEHSDVELRAKLTRVRNELFRTEENKPCMVHGPYGKLVTCCAEAQRLNFKCDCHCHRDHAIQRLSLAQQAFLDLFESR